jgi:hypothetical protein
MTKRPVAIEVRAGYVPRERADRGAFNDLMAQLQTVTEHLAESAGLPPNSYRVIDHPKHAGGYVEIFQFSTAESRARFDDMYCSHRATCVLQVLLDELLDDNRSHFESKGR